MRSRIGNAKSTCFSMVIGFILKPPQLSVYGLWIDIFRSKNKNSSTIAMIEQWSHGHSLGQTYGKSVPIISPFVPCVSACALSNAHPFHLYLVHDTMYFWRFSPLLLGNCSPTKAKHEACKV